MKAVHFSRVKDREIKDGKQLKPPQTESSHQEAIPGKPTNSHRYSFGQCIFLQHRRRPCELTIFLRIQLCNITSFIYSCVTHNICSIYNNTSSSLHPLQVILHKHRHGKVCKSHCIHLSAPLSTG